MLLETNSYLTIWILGPTKSIGMTVDNMRLIINTTCDLSVWWWSWSHLIILSNLSIEDFHNKRVRSEDYGNDDEYMLELAWTQCDIEQLNVPTAPCPHPLVNIMDCNLLFWCLHQCEVMGGHTYSAPN